MNNCFVLILTFVLFSGCYHHHHLTTSFTNANKLSNIKATVFLDDNRTYTGYLTLETKKETVANLFQPQPRANIQLPIHTITSYEVEGVFYVAKYIEPSNNSIYIYGKPHAEKHFVKLLTPKNFKIKLFSDNEYLKQQKSSLLLKNTNYYISFEDAFADTLLNVNHANFSKIFTTQMQQLCKKNIVFANEFEKINQTKSTSNKIAEDKIKFLLNVAELYAATTN